MSRHIWKRMIIVLAVCVVGILVALMKALYFPVIYPIKSSSNELTLVNYSGFDSNKPVITLRHYVNDLHVHDYTLTIENGIHDQEPQTYKLPELNEGRVKIDIETGENENSCFSTSYIDAVDIYKSGLLLYFTTNGDRLARVDGEHIYDRYIYFVLGKRELCYFKHACLSEWSLINDAPPLKRLPAKDDGADFYGWYSGWKENEWVVIDINN